MWSYQHQNFSVHQLPALHDNYIYLIEDHNSDAVMAVDPADAAPVRKACKALGKPLTHILNTHHHWDHTDGNKSLKSSFDCRIVGAAIDAGRIPGIDQPVDEGDLQIDGLSFRVLFVPGHTSGHIAYRIEDALFCGDVLFGAGCGRIFEGSFEQMWDSLQKLADLPDETRIYCAHEYTLHNLHFAMSVDVENRALQQRLAEAEKRQGERMPTVPSTLAEEKATNPMLRPLNGDFCRVYARQHRLVAEPLAVFSHIRTARNSF